MDSGGADSGTYCSRLTADCETIDRFRKDSIRFFGSPVGAGTPPPVLYLQKVVQILLLCGSAASRSICEI